MKPNTAAFVIVCGLLASACSSNATNRATAEKLVVERGTFRPRMVLSGEIRAVRAVNIIVPRTPSWQLPVRWLEEDGAFVTEGQKILELDNAQFTGELEQKRLEANGAINQLLQKRADVAGSIGEQEFALERTRLELEKARVEAAVPEDIRRRREYQDAQLAMARAEVAWEKAREELVTTREVSEAEIRELQINLDKARAEIRTAEQAIEVLVLFAPRDGILVVEENRQEGRKFQSGDNVWVGQTVMRIPDLREMKVEAQLSDVDDGKVTVGMRARCAVDAYPDLIVEGQITEIMPIAKEQGRDSLRRAFQVTLLLDRSDPERLRPGMSTRVEITPRPREDVLLIPRAGLDLNGETPRARLADGSAVEVLLGPCDPHRCVVLEGVSEGARLRPAPGAA